MTSSKICPRYHLQELKKMVIKLQENGFGDDYLMSAAEDLQRMTKKESKTQVSRDVA